LLVADARTTPISEEATRDWATLAYAWYTTELGGDSKHAKEMRMIAEHPKQHPGWGVREKEKVGGPAGSGEETIVI
jgi:hypothetical protein